MFSATWNFFNLLSFDIFFSALLLVITIAIFVIGVGNLYLDASYVPKFLRSLLLYGKFGREKRLIEDKHCSKNSSFENVSDFINYFLKRLEVPKSWFRHFYIYLFIVWTLVIFYLFSTGKFEQLMKPNSIIFLGIILFQSLRRIYETQYVSIYSDNKVNVIHYMVAYLFYSIFGYATSKSIENVVPGTPPVSTIIVLIVFAIASVIQFHSHVILARLRTKYSKNNLKTISYHSYHIPCDGLFSLIACPHYLAEIIIYYTYYQIGTNISTKKSYLWLSILLFVMVNQTIASLVTLRWYKVKFGSQYPPKVKAILPYFL